MQYIKLLVIAIAVLGFVYKLALSIVKYRSANNPTPENLKDVYDEETYEKWKKYSAEHCRQSVGKITAAVFPEKADMFGNTLKPSALNP